MNVHVRRSTPIELQLEFKTDAADALVPVPNVWFRYDKADEVSPLRVCLLAYLLARPFIGNSFSVSGIRVPAHLASRMQQDFDADEFFIGPVTNIPSQILPDFAYEAIITDPEDGSNPGMNDQRYLICTRNELGYRLAPSWNGASAPLQIRTNVDLYTAFTDQPTLLSLVSVYLCAFDGLGIKCLRVRSRPESEAWVNRTRPLLAEVGGALVALSS